LTDAPVYEVGSRDGILALLSLRDQFVFLGKDFDPVTSRPFRITSSTGCSRPRRVFDGHVMVLLTASRIVQWRRAVQEREESYRLYSCRGCSVSVRICGRCDHGNIFCAGETYYSGDALRTYQGD
jgi:hypothetical protein